MGLAGEADSPAESQHFCNIRKKSSEHILKCQCMVTQDQKSFGILLYFLGYYQKFLIALKIMASLQPPQFFTCISFYQEYLNLIFYLYSGNCMEKVRITLFPILCPCWFWDDLAFSPFFFLHLSHMLSILLCSSAENIRVPEFVNPQFHYFLSFLTWLLIVDPCSLDFSQILQ